MDGWVISFRECRAELIFPIQDVLFNSEQELRQYQMYSKVLHGGRSYFSFANLSQAAETLISGVSGPSWYGKAEVNLTPRHYQLLRVNPPSRFGIADLMRQPYFLLRDGYVILADLAYYGVV